MKLLYVSSVHTTLEHNDLYMFTDIGLDCFSTGVYVDPRRTLAQFRHYRDDSIDTMVYKSDLIEEFTKDNPTYFSRLKDYDRPTITISKSFADKFDIILFNSFFENVKNNWENVKHKTVIWRTYSNQTPKQEYESNQLESLHRVRVWSNECKISNSKESIAIPGHVDEDWFCDWVGNKSEILSFQNAFHERCKDTTGQAYLQLIKKLKYNSVLYGDFPNRHRLVKGHLSLADQKKAYQEYQVYFSIGSRPAPVTFNFVEAWVIGIPVVTFGYGIATNPLYQVPEIITNGVDGFYSDDIDDLADIITSLLEDESLRKQISCNGRKKAISLVGKQVVTEQWRQFFKSIL